MDEQKEYLLLVQVKNNKLLSLMKKNGITSLEDLKRKSGCGTVCNLIANLKMSAVNKKTGEINVSVLKLADFFNVEPCDLFPAKNYLNELQKNTSEREISFEEISLSINDMSDEDPLKLLEMDDMKKNVHTAISKLDTRSADILTRIAIDEEEIKDVARLYGLSSTRVRQIYQKSIRVLRKPSSGLVVIAKQEGIKK